MVEDAPDDLVHEVFAQQFWTAHPLGRPILGTPETVGSFNSAGLREYFTRTYVAPNLLIVAAGNLEHARVAALINRIFEGLPDAPAPPPADPPVVTPGIAQRRKEIEQSHICIGTPAYPLTHENRHATYVLNTILGGSMSSRLFQHIREDRGLAYAVFSNMTAYSDAGMFAVYAGCATDKVNEVVGLTLAELRALRQTPVDAQELSRAKDHLKGSLMLGLEHTSSRMSNLARQHIYFGRHFTMDEVLAEIDRVTADDVQRVAGELFQDGAVVASVVGPEAEAPVSREELGLSA
jgi:predicted Zn-dependent peptidase